eukprot:1626368-Alexandrium_andersonii.AAC.1
MAKSPEVPAVRPPPARAAVLPPRPASVPPDAHWDPVKGAWFALQRRVVAGKSPCLLYTSPSPRD